jgi:Flp pilus assembly protein TadB
MTFVRGAASARIVDELLTSYQREDEATTLHYSTLSSSLGRLAARANVPIQRIYRGLGISCGLAVVGSCIGGVGVGTVVGAIAVVVTLGRLYVRARARRHSIDRDLPALLTSVASSVRAGIDPLQALLEARDYFPSSSVLVEEIGVIKRGIAAGEEENVLVEGFLSSFNHPDGELFKRCLLLSRRHGSSLSEPLHRVTRVVRQRQSFRRKTSAALAMHRMSAMGISVCALFIGAVQVGMNAEGVINAFHHPMGGKFLAGGVAMILIGVVWMMSMGSVGEVE